MLYTHTDVLRTQEGEDRELNRKQKPGLLFETQHRIKTLEDEKEEEEKQQQQQQHQQ